MSCFHRTFDPATGAGGLPWDAELGGKPDDFIPTVPANTVAPVISGTVLIGETLTSTTGTWTGQPAPTFTYQWTLAGANITGATAATYVLTAADVVGTNVACTVTATNVAGATAQASNNLAFDPNIVATMLIDLRADVGVTQATAPLVNSWVESVASVDFSQATQADRPALVTSSFGGADGVEFDIGNSEGLHVATGPTASSGSVSCFASVDQTSASTTQYMVDTETGRLVIELGASPSATVGWYDGAHKETGSATVGEQILTWILTSGGNGECFREGLSLGTAAYTALAIGDQMGIGERMDGASSNNIDAVIRHLFLYASALSAAQQTTIRTWMAADSGISIWDPTQLTGLFASYFSFQGKTLVGSDVDVWADQTNSNNLTAVTAGERPAQSLASANMGGQDVLDFGSGDRIKGAAAAAWNALHDGTGGSIHIAFWSNSASTPQTLLDTNDGSATARGIYAFYDGSDTKVTVQIGNATTAVYAFTSASASVALNTPHLLTIRFLDGRAGNEIDVSVDGVSLNTANTTNDPSTGDAAFPLAVGELSDAGTGPLIGEVFGIWACSAYTADADVTLLDTWVGRAGV